MIEVDIKGVFPVVKRMVRQISAKEARKFVKEIIDLHEAEEISRRTRERFGAQLNNGMAPAS